MHILGILGAIVTILILLKRLADAGIDIGWLNPFLWHRRRSWRARHDADPVHSMNDPLEVTALLMLAVAKASGEISTEQKTALLDSYSSSFHLDRDGAARLMTASAFLLKDGAELDRKLEAIVGRCIEQFTPGQAASAIELCEAVVDGEPPPVAEQGDLLGRIKRALSPAVPAPMSATWA